MNIIKAFMYCEYPLKFRNWSVIANDSYELFIINHEEVHRLGLVQPYVKSGWCSTLIYEKSYAFDKFGWLIVKLESIVKSSHDFSEYNVD